MRTLFLIFLGCYFSFAQSQNSVSIFYEIGSYKINTKNERLLSLAIDKLDQTKKYKVVIESSTDYLGQKK